MVFFKHYTNKNKKNIYYFSTVYGIGLKKAYTLCCLLGLDVNSINKELSFHDKNKLNYLLTSLNKFYIGADLKKYTYDRIKRTKQIRSYKGIRHSTNLPVNGQNTKNNAKTQK